MEFETRIGVLGMIVSLNVIKNIFVQLLVISEKPNNINLDNYKKNKEKLKREMKEDKHMNNSFKLLRFLKKDFCIAKNELFMCLSSFISLLSFSLYFL